MSLMSVGIITAPRKPHYLGVSLDSYFRHWDVTPHVFEEPKTPIYLHHPRVIRHQNVYKHGCVMNWLHSARTMMSICSSPYIMMCEDDIEWTREAAFDMRSMMLDGRIKLPRYLYRNQSEVLSMDKVGFISPYCSVKNRFELLRGEWHEARVGVGGWAGALALLFPRKSLEVILSNSEEFLHHTTFQTVETKIMHLDYAIGKTLTDRGYKLLTHNPTLVRHLGEISTHEMNNRVYNESREPAL